MAKDSLIYYSDNDNDFSFREKLIRELFVKKSKLLFFLSTKTIFNKCVKEADEFLELLFADVDAKEE